MRARTECWASISIRTRSRDSSTFRWTIDKRRPSANIAEVVNVVGEVEGKDCLIPDDMIDTAGTITEAAAALRRLGAGRIFAFATHALLSGPAVERLRASPIEEVTVTNTIA